MQVAKNRPLSKQVRWPSTHGLPSEGTDGFCGAVLEVGRADVDTEGVGNNVVVEACSSVLLGATSVADAEETTEETTGESVVGIDEMVLGVVAVVAAAVELVTAGGVSGGHNGKVLEAELDVELELEAGSEEGVSVSLPSLSSPAPSAGALARGLPSQCILNRLSSLRSMDDPGLGNAMAICLFKASEVLQPLLTSPMFAMNSSGKSSCRFDKALRRSGRLMRFLLLAIMLMGAQFMYTSG